MFTSALALLAKMWGLIPREKEFSLKSFIWQFSAFITLKHFAKFQKKKLFNDSWEKAVTDERMDGQAERWRWF